ATLAGVTLGGSLVGGTGSYVNAAGYFLGTGSILSEGALGAVRVARDVQGGPGDSSAYVQAVRIGNVTVGGSFATGPVGFPVILAVGTKDSGGQSLNDGSIGPVRVA